MPATNWKILNKNSPGTSTTFGADDWDLPGRYHNDIDLSATAPSSIKTNTRYWDNRLRIWNPAKTFSYQFRSSALLANRDITLPLLTGNDEIAMLMHTSEFQNKTINSDLNTLRNTSNAIGDLLVGNGTKYARLTMGSTGGYVLAIKNDLTGLEWVSPTAASAGTDVVLVREAGVQVGSAARRLNFTNASNFDITEDAGANEIEIDIADNAITDSLVAPHTTTKITTTAKAQLSPEILYGDLTTPNVTQMGWLNTRHQTAHCGLLNGICVPTGSHITGLATGGPFSNYFTGAVSGDQSGFRTNIRLMERQHNAKLMARVLISDTTSQRMFIGWADETALFRSGSDPLNTISGIGIWVDHGLSGNINFIRNDGAGAGTITEYVPTTAMGTSRHTFELTANEANTRFEIKVDGQAVHFASSNIPSSGTEMALMVYTETTTTATRSMQLSDLKVKLEYLI